MTVRQYKTLASGNSPGEGGLTLGGVSDEFRQMKADIAQYLQSLGVVGAVRGAQAGVAEEYTVGTGTLDLTQNQGRTGQNFFVVFTGTNRTSAVKIRLFGQAAADLKRTVHNDFEISGIKIDRVYHIAWDSRAYSLVNSFAIEDIGRASLNWDSLDGDLPVDRIEDDSIPYDKLTGTIPVNQIEDGSIQNDKLDIADDSVSYAKLTGEIPLTQVADLGIPTGKIADEAITTDKIADGAITIEKVSPEVIPPPVALPGMIIAYAGTMEPDGWLFCDGRTLMRDDYQELFEVIRDRWGTTGTGNFNLPDLRQRVIAGASANNLNRLDAWMLGQNIGLKEHTLTAAQSGLPAHDHAISRHRHGEVEPGGIQVAGNNDASTTRNPDRALRTQPNEAQDAAEAHSIVQPTMIMNYIIKT